ncbi:MAG: transposase [Patescibacteria group bacterium]
MPVDYPQGVYFLTRSTMLHYPYFKRPEEKEILLEQIRRLHKEKDIQICAYSIAINHYHMMFYATKDADVSIVKQFMHGGVSFLYRKRYPKTPKNMWGTMKTLRVWNERMYWNVIAYICGNLLKHREVGTFGELLVNPFSSYGHFAKKYGEDCMKEGIYKIIDVPEGAEGDVSMEDLKAVHWSGLKSA